MATTEEEWERLFRQRLENYESEPNEDALERILTGAKPSPIEKSAGWRGRMLTAGVGVLSVLGLLIPSVWQYREWSAGPRAQSAVSTKSVSAGSPTQPAGTVRPSADPNQPGNPTVSFATPPAPVHPTAKSGSVRASSVPSNARIAALPPPTTRSKDDWLTSGPGTGRWRAASRPGPAGPLAHFNDNLNQAYAVKTSTNSSATDRTDTKAVRPESELNFSPIAIRLTRISFPKPVLSPIASETYYQAPAVEPERRINRPSLVASVMPLYTFRQLTPSNQDEVVMEKIRPATSFSARTGWRAQIGAEWPLTRSFGLRVGAVYQRLQQEMTYTARALRSDSSKVEWVDSQTIKLTPLYKTQERHVKNTWQYVALSAEGRWQLNPGQTGIRHYLTAGGSLGYLIQGRSKQHWQPLLQASYGIERQLTNQLRLQIEPGFVYNLTAINDNSRCFSVRPYSYGLVIGLRWQPNI